MVTSLENSGLKAQFVYVPVRSNSELSARRNEKLSHTQYRISKVLHPHHRLFFRRKISAVASDLISAVRVGDYSLIHSHFLFSDGAVALQLNKTFGLPYVVAVRNTDVNVFLKYRPDLRSIGYEILRKASAIIFISPCYREHLFKKIPPQVVQRIDQKTHIVPNGISSFWLQEPLSLAPRPDTALRLLYVGDFSKNKNVPNTIRAAEMVREKMEVQLTLVGGGRSGSADVLSMLESGRYPWIDYRGRIDDKGELAAVYRAHDIFVMPSFKETFGVVYIEALSQGLPIVHSEKQGVDGYFEAGTVAEAAKPDDPQDIAQKIALLAGRLDEVRGLCHEQARRFDWNRVAATYLNIYRAAIKA